MVRGLAIRLDAEVFNRNKQIINKKPDDFSSGYIIFMIRALG